MALLFQQTLDLLGNMFYINEQISLMDYISDSKEFG